MWIDRIFAGIGLAGAAAAIVIGILAVRDVLGSWKTPALGLAALLFVAGVLAILSGIVGWVRPKPPSTTPAVQNVAGPTAISYGQQGGLTAGAATLIVGRPPRTFAGTDMAPLEARLRKHPRTEVRIDSWGGDAEAVAFGMELSELLKRVGWNTRHRQIMGYPPIPRGLTLLAGDSPDPPPSVVDLANGLHEALHIPVSVVRQALPPATKLVILVGSS